MAVVAVTLTQGAAILPAMAATLRMVVEVEAVNPGPVLQHLEQEVEGAAWGGVMVTTHSVHHHPVCLHWCILTLCAVGFFCVYVLLLLLCILYFT
jgi:hypothetical protein